MTFKREICKNYYLCDTPVENIFIDEYMLDAPGEYVKVYLYAYMYSDLNQVLSNELLAKRLGVNIEDVLGAWTYWENVGIIRKYFPNPEDETHYDVEFINMKDALFSARVDSSEEKQSTKKSNSMREILLDEELASLYKEIESITGKMFDPSNAVKIANLVDEDGADPSVIAFAYRFCKENNKSTDFNYIAAIVRKWIENGQNTVKDVKDFLESSDNRFAEHRQIMKGLGLNYSSITDEERRVFNSWMDEMGFNLAFILDVCGKAAGMSHKFSYVKKVLESEYDKKNGGTGQVPKKRTLNDRQKYYETIRRENQIKSQEHRDNVYKKVPEVYEIDEELRTLGMEVGKIMLTGADNKAEASEVLKSKIRDKQNKKAELMKNAGFPTNYLEDIYNCYRCKDTGILDDGGHCSCYKISAD